MVIRILLTTKFSKDPLSIYFPSPRKKEELKRDLLDKSKGRQQQNILIEHEGEKISIDKKNINAVVYPKDALFLKVLDQSIMILSLYFDSGFKVEVPITGQKRAGNMFRKLIPLRDLKPPKLWITLNQDEDKRALVRHSEFLRQVVLKELIHE